jgi:cation:H+ antiporter
MAFVTLLWFILGLVLLIGGAELLVRGAARLAKSLGMSSLVVGLTVVAFGTSSPELAVCVRAAFMDQPGVVLGNVVGSNISNVLLVLGISALVAPLVVARQLVRLDVPIMIGVSVLFFALAADGSLTRLDGIVMFFGMVVYTAFAIRLSRRERRRPGAEADARISSLAAGKKALVDGLLIVGGLVLLVLGSRWLVQGALAIAERLGVSELIVGLTVVAVGTSLPEIATSIIAGFRGERDIAVGNVVGSNILNVLGVLGLTSLVAPKGVAVPASALRFDMPVMLAAAVACLPIFYTGHRIARWEGGVFLSYYAAYVLYLILGSLHHEASGPFSTIMLAFVIPLTALTLGILAFRSWRAKKLDSRHG